MRQYLATGSANQIELAASLANPKSSHGAADWGSTSEDCRDAVNLTLRGCCGSQGSWDSQRSLRQSSGLKTAQLGESCTEKSYSVTRTNWCTPPAAKGIGDTELTAASSAVSSSRLAAVTGPRLIVALAGSISINLSSLLTAAACFCATGIPSGFTLFRRHKVNVIFGYAGSLGGSGTGASLLRPLLHRVFG